MRYGSVKCGGSTVFVYQAPYSTCLMLQAGMKISGVYKACV